MQSYNKPGSLNFLKIAKDLVLGFYHFLSAKSYLRDTPETMKPIFAQQESQKNVVLIFFGKFDGETSFIPIIFIPKTSFYKFIKNFLFSWLDA